MRRDYSLGLAYIYVRLFAVSLLMISKIRLIEPYYSKLEYILPEDAIHNSITEEFERAKNEVKKIIEEDLKNIQAVARSENKVIAFNKFSKPL